MMDNLSKLNIIMRRKANMKNVIIKQSINEIVFTADSKFILFSDKSKFIPNHSGKQGSDENANRLICFLWYSNKKAKIVNIIEN